MAKEVEKKSFTMADFAKKLNKEYSNNNLVIKSDVVPVYKRLTSGQMGIDYPLYGGLPYGRMAVFAGLEHSGKTTAACAQLAAYQRENPDKICVYVDVEHSLDLKFQAAMCGLDISKLLYIDPVGLSGEQICDLIIELQKGDNIGLIVLDSLPALIPQAVLENDMTKDAGMRGTMAKKLYPFLAVMQSEITAKNNMLICINQVRDDGKTFTGIQKWKEPCGGAPQFYSSVSVRFGTRKFTKEDDMDACGATNGEGADGFRLQFKIMKNKTAPCNRGGGFMTFRYATGMDWLHDLLEIAIGFNFIPRLNNVTYQLVNLETGEPLYDEEGRELKGKKADLIEYIKTNIPFQAQYLAMLNRAIANEEASYGSLLDARAAAEIDAQERAVSDEAKAANIEEA